MNCITVDGDYKFDIDAYVTFKGRKWQVKHRYTERFERNLNAINRYVIWHQPTNIIFEASENVLKVRKEPQRRLK
jgi:hypothetical protein